MPRTSNLADVPYESPQDGYCIGTNCPSPWWHPQPNASGPSTASLDSSRKKQGDDPRGGLPPSSASIWNSSGAIGQLSPLLICVTETGFAASETPSARLAISLFSWRAAFLGSKCGRAFGGT